MSSCGEEEFLSFFSFVAMATRFLHATDFLRNLQRDHARIIPVNFGQNWPSSLEGEDALYAWTKAGRTQGHSHWS